jgi:hypothetical protein
VVIGVRAATLVAGLTAALAVAGCSGKTFRPVMPRAAVDPDVGVNVDDIYVTHFPGVTFDETYGIRMNLEVSWRAPTRIGEARLTSAAAPLCASGVKATQMVSAERYGAGPERIALAFSRPAAEANHLFDQPSSVLDLTLFPTDRSAPGRCIRIALVEPSGPPDAAQWLHRPFLIGGEERVMIIHSQIPGVESVGLVLGLGVGFWNQRWRWMLGVEGGFTGRSDTTTGATGEGRLYGMGGFSAAASTLLFKRGGFGLGAIGGYELLHGTASGPSVNTPPSLMLHGPRVGLRLLYLIDPLQWPGFRSPPDAFTAGLTIYAGNWWNGTDLHSASPFLGFSLEGNLGF